MQLSRIKQAKRTKLALRKFFLNLKLLPGLKSKSYPLFSYSKFSINKFAKVFQFIFAKITPRCHALLCLQTAYDGERLKGPAALKIVVILQSTSPGKTGCT
jgi:hypothetical protein